MGKDVPQQPELHRSRRGETDPDGRRISREVDDRVRSEGEVAPVPPSNRPGHRPDVEQDKPQRPPPGPPPS